MKSLLRARRDGFLSDSFLFSRFLIGADGSSRTNLLEAALDRIIQRWSQAICRAGGRSARQQVTRNTAATLARRGRSVVGDGQDTSPRRRPKIQIESQLLRQRRAWSSIEIISRIENAD
jgi:hypothetical protein